MKSLREFWIPLLLFIGAMLLGVLQVIWFYWNN
jgi:hypothetical protein